jgi:hypothetical protein
MIEMNKQFLLLADCYGSSLCCVRGREGTSNSEYWEHHAVKCAPYALYGCQYVGHAHGKIFSGRILVFDCARMNINRFCFINLSTGNLGVERVEFCVLWIV